MIAGDNAGRPGRYAVHPAAELFPMLGEEEIAELAEDIRARGQLVPIEIYQGKILDGRNRLAACERAAVAPRVRKLATIPGGSPTAYVLSLNAKRRHLNALQRAAVAAEAEPFFAEEARERQRAAAAATNEKRKAEPPPAPQAKPPAATAPASVVTSAEGQNVPKRGQNEGARATHQAAKAVGAGIVATKDMLTVQRKAPEVFALAKSGAVETVADAKRVAELPAPQRAEAVKKIEAGASAREALQEARRSERVEKLAEISRGETPLTGALGRFPVILADPPWRYEHVETESRAIENQYPTMDLDAICALPVAEIATPDAVLFCWATSPKLSEAMRVIAAWGFSYRTCAVWVKDKIGMGYYFRQRHELLLVAVRGAPPVPPPAARADSVIEAVRGEHSAKPAEVHGLIERMYPELRRVELFCRTPREGWSAWGNQS